MSRNMNVVKDLNMQDVIVVGGGWAGCTAAVSAAKAGAITEDTLPQKS